MDEQEWHYIHRLIIIINGALYLLMTVCPHAKQSWTEKRAHIVKTIYLSDRIIL